MSDRSGQQIVTRPSFHDTLVDEAQHGAVIAALVGGRERTATRPSAAPGATDRDLIVGRRLVPVEERLCLVDRRGALVVGGVDLAHHPDHAVGPGGIEPPSECGQQVASAARHVLPRTRLPARR